jgi:hypothetical protein
MNVLDRAATSANSLAEDTVSSVSSVGTALAEAVVNTTRDIQSGVRSGRIRPATAVAAAALGGICVVEFPVILAVAAVALVISKLRDRNSTEEE